MKRINKDASSRSFGEVIRERRRQLDLTQEEVAQRIKTSIPYIGHLEANKRRPSDATVSRLADALGLERSELFFLANPQARALFGTPASRPAQTSTWEEFKNDEQMQRTHEINPQELEMLEQVALMGDVRSTRDFVYILNTVRQALSR